jgi:hypothetical protein
MRVRDPVDYSSVVLGVLCRVRSCYRSLNRGAFAQSNYDKESLSCCLSLGLTLPERGLNSN